VCSLKLPFFKVIILSAFAGVFAGRCTCNNPSSGFFAYGLFGACLGGSGWQRYPLLSEWELAASAKETFLLPVEGDDVCGFLLISLDFLILSLSLDEETFACQRGVADPSPMEDIRAVPSLPPSSLGVLSSSLSIIMSSCS